MPKMAPVVWVELRGLLCHRMSQNGPPNRPLYPVVTLPSEPYPASAPRMDRTALYTLAILSVPPPATTIAQKPIQPSSRADRQRKLLGVLTPTRKSSPTRAFPYAAPAGRRSALASAAARQRWKHILLPATSAPTASSPAATPTWSFTTPAQRGLPDAQRLGARPKHRQSPRPNIPRSSPSWCGSTAADSPPEAHRRTVRTANSSPIGGRDRRLHELPPRRLRLHGPPRTAAESAKQRLRQLRLMDQTAAIAWVRRNIAASAATPPTSQSSASRPDRSPSARRSPPHR